MIPFINHIFVISTINRVQENTVIRTDTDRIRLTDTLY